jgi:hypothetical protein
LFDERQLIVRRVVGERQAAAVDRVPQWHVGPFEVDVGPNDASAGDVRKPALAGCT